MVRIGNDLVVVGGAVGGTHLHFSKSLFKLSCFNNNCQWETLIQELKIPRTNSVAVAIPDDFN